MKYPDSFDDFYIDDEQDLEGLEPAVATAVLVHALEAEVNNGGFDQFFLNSSGRFALQTVEALHAIGADHTSKLLEQAIRIAYPDGYPDNAADHEDTTDSDDALDRLAELDEQFLEYDDPLTDLVNQYLERHDA